MSSVTTWMQPNWVALVSVYFLITLAFAVAPPIRRRLAQASVGARVGLVIFVLIPVLLIPIGVGIILSPRRYQVPAFRSIFLVIVCLLPASMYYLFIATRKSSLLNEFITILDRLGLLASTSLSQP